MFPHKSRPEPIPRSSDRARTYLYLKHGLGSLFSLRQRDRLEDTLKVVTLAALNNAYVEGTAASLGQCGQTIRNRLKQQDPSRFFSVNAEVVERMRSSGALSRPVPLAIDTHDEMFYGDPASEGVTGTRYRKGSHYAYRFATASVLAEGQRVTVAITPFAVGPVVDHVVGKVLDQLGVRHNLFRRWGVRSD